LYHDYYGIVFDRSQAKPSLRYRAFLHHGLLHSTQTMRANCHPYQLPFANYQHFYRASAYAYACRARYCYGKSVRPSVRPSVTLWHCIETNAHNVKLLPPSARGTTSFLSTTDVTIFQGEPPKRGVKYTGVGKFCNFRLKSPFILPGFSRAMTLACLHILGI